MADARIGNIHGVAQVGPVDAKIAEITADGANTFTTSAADAHKFFPGQIIVFRVKATGAGFGTNRRSVVSVTAAGVVTYSGADIALVPGTHAVYDDMANNYATATTAKDGGSRSNMNGGYSSRDGYSDIDAVDIESARNALIAYSSTTYTAAVLNTMTFNDMLFALRTIRTPVGVRGY